MASPVLDVTQSLKLVGAFGVAYAFVSSTLTGVWRWFAARKAAAAKLKADGITQAKIEGAAELLAAQHKESMEKAAAMQADEMKQLILAVKDTDCRLDGLAAYFDLKWKNGMVNAWVPKTARASRAKVKA